tara:strand:- start:32 stop:919 length:888 start_codon:yes stop_codon:yes gene_type:complete
MKTKKSISKFLNKTLKKQKLKGRNKLLIIPIEIKLNDTKGRGKELTVKKIKIRRQNKSAKKSTVMKSQNPTLDHYGAYRNLYSKKGIKMTRPPNQTRNKGWFGQELERTLNMTLGSARTDFPRGDLKGLTVTVKDDTVIPSDTTFVTQVNNNDLPKLWRDSIVNQKIENILFAPYARDKKKNSEEAIIISPVLVNNITNPEIYRQFQEDYEDIQNKLCSVDGKCNITGTTNGRNGKLQIRTKGQGKGKPKTFAFYITRKGTKELLNKIKIPLTIDEQSANEELKQLSKKYDGIQI